MLVRIANREDPDHSVNRLLLQNQSDLGLNCLSGNNCLNSRTSTMDSCVLCMF